MRAGDRVLVLGELRGSVVGEPTRGGMVRVLLDDHDQPRAYDPAEVEPLEEATP